MRKGDDAVSESNEAARAVVDAVHRIAAAFDNHDVASLYAAHYQGPETTLIAQGGERAIGWAAVQDELEKRINEFEVIHTTIDKPEVVLFGNLAVVTYEQHTNSRLHDIDFTWVGWVTDIYIQVESQWLRIHHQASDRKKS
jgi:ketosteroid isomerase-like protein